MDDYQETDTTIDYFWEEEYPIEKKEECDCKSYCLGCLGIDYREFM